VAIFDASDNGSSRINVKARQNSQAVIPDLIWNPAFLNPLAELDSAPDPVRKCRNDGWRIFHRIGVSQQNERGPHRKLTRPHFRMDSFAGLQVVDDLKEVVRTWVALRPEHAHKALGRYVGSFR
jgi:hypothetical protein